MRGTIPRLGLPCNAWGGTFLSMAETRNLPRQIVVRVSETTYERLREAAMEDRRPHTQLARKIIEDWLDEQAS